ncbi:hypothetical protein OOT55_17050 [Marinimicrobium sp. C6131]|uniref:hypothetical protein n=1 Tax=Marinimicrobium sp. C6131 TaxID=3022676 RepID=UPI00223E144D|nr:hypothetical protein [Marinimicrobium sp. C6131]UZJ44345.1 hypothetical protein OOT55_17050 [Marinimicrobium sp. C6131]
MSVNINLNLPEEIRHIKSLRDINWLWGWLQHNIGGLDPSKFGSTQGKREEIHGALNRADNPLLTSQIARRCHAEMLLPETDIRWIEKADQRLIDWLSISMFSSNVDDLYNPLIPEALSPNAAFVCKIDLMDEDLSVKKQTIKGLSETWQNIKAYDHQLKWLSKTNQTQCQWAWDYLAEKRIGWFGLKRDPRKDLYAQVLTRFDTWRCHSDSRKLLVSNMRKSWSQKKFRDKNTNTKQCNFRLPIATKDKLNNLATLRGKSVNQLLDELIREEFDRTSNNAASHA